MKIKSCLFIYLWEFPISSEFFGPTRIYVRSWWLCSNHPATPRSSRRRCPDQHPFRRVISQHRDAGDLRTHRGNTSCRQDRHEASRVRWRADRTGVVLILVAFPKMKWLFNFLRKIIIVINMHNFFWTNFVKNNFLTTCMISSVFKKLFGYSKILNLPQKPW